MKSLSIISAILLSIFVLCATFVPAAYAGGGGRAVITVTSAGVAGGKSAEIVATIYKDNDYKLSVDEFGLFRVANAITGQNCITKNQRSNSEGKIYGSCSSPISGDMRVYIHFPDKVEDAQQYSVTILPAGSTINSAPVVSASSYGPCGSGLTAHGWDPANGKNCPQDHYDAWTAYCGNGYQQDVKIGNCLHANELSSHPEWQAVAQGICNNPRCDIPKPRIIAATTKPTAKPTPKPTAAQQPTLTPSDTSMVTTPSATPVVVETKAQVSFATQVRNALTSFVERLKNFWLNK